jgi:hypothetical protein
MSQFFEKKQKDSSNHSPNRYLYHSRNQQKIVSSGESKHSSSPTRSEFGSNINLTTIPLRDDVEIKNNLLLKSTVVQAMDRRNNFPERARRVAEETTGEEWARLGLMGGLMGYNYIVSRILQAPSAYQRTFLAALLNFSAVRNAPRPLLFATLFTGTTMTVLSSMIGGRPIIADKTQQVMKMRPY